MNISSSDYLVYLAKSLFIYLSNENKLSLTILITKVRMRVCNGGSGEAERASQRGVLQTPL